MNLPKMLFTFVYLITPLTYIVVYSAFTVIRKNDVFTALNQVLPMIALYVFHCEYCHCDTVRKNNERD
ncbi:hypothetical protein [Staphylococcus delphini]|uniref:hypothetical protein n=1 Tax=Staphylococcus delphini TaxID=53344 RepID=UPI001F4D3E47|nr:hypothetical protein [Staphylococcus delphini]